MCRGNGGGGKRRAGVVTPNTVDRRYRCRRCKRRPCAFWKRKFLVTSWIVYLGFASVRCRPLLTSARCCVWVGERRLVSRVQCGSSGRFRSDSTSFANVGQGSGWLEACLARSLAGWRADRLAIHLSLYWLAVPSWLRRLTGLLAGWLPMADLPRPDGKLPPQPENVSTKTKNA